MPEGLDLGSVISQDMKMACCEIVEVINGAHQAILCTVMNRF